MNFSVESKISSKFLSKILEIKYKVKNVNRNNLIHNELNIRLIIQSNYLSFLNQLVMTWSEKFSKNNKWKNQKKKFLKF